MFSFEREELGDEFELPMDTKGGRTMVALPILVSLKPKEKRMTKQICLPGWTKQRMGLSRTWCWTARTLWNGFFHQEMCQSFMTIIRSYSRCWDWTQLRFLTLQCCGFEFECEFQHYFEFDGTLLDSAMLWFELVLTLSVSLNMGPEFAWPFWCKVQHFSPGLSAGLEGLPWVPTEDHVPRLFNSFSGTSFAVLLWVLMFKHAHVWRRRFTVCDICEQFKSQLHDPAVPLPEKLGCVKAYRAHLKSQYSDRSLLWQLCDLAYSREGDIMLIWIDGMEQAKFAVPRSRGLKTASATILD